MKKKEIKQRAGYRKLIYFDGNDNHLNGTWQWKCGRQVISIFSPDGKKWTPWVSELTGGDSSDKVFWPQATGL